MPNRDRLLCCVVSAALLAAEPALAGNYDTHLAMTHYLARLKAIDEKSAALIARADWSMDENRSTTAMPWVHIESIVKIPQNWIDDKSLTDRAGATGWKERGTTYHMFEKDNDPKKVRENLNKLRHAIPKRVEGEEAYLLGVGQYLHAMQDVYFHQNEGKPLGPGLGHSLTKEAGSTEGGESADKVTLRFDKALLALDETAKVMQAVKDGKDKEIDIPDINWDRVYEKREAITPAFAASFDPEIIKLASAAAQAYDSFDSGKPHQLNEDVLEANLATLWVLQGHTEPFKPYVKLTTGDRALINYDTHPGWLIVRAPEPKPLPGGISFSEAAASRMPINLSVDGILIDKGRIILSGRSADNLQHFDAAQLLTGFRLACTHGDPYFSLDPVDPAAWGHEFGAEGQTYWHEQLTALVDPPDIDPLDDPRIGRASFEHRYIDSRSPVLQSKLVFAPVWLRTTRFGKVLYDADVLLKMLASGMAMADGVGPTHAPGLVGYHSSDERSVVSNLLTNVEGGTLPPPNGSRLWFQLADVATPSPFANFGPTVLPTFPDLRYLSSPPPLTSRKIYLDAVKERLRQASLADGSDDFGVSANSNGSTVSISGSAMDLESVWPKMFVHNHDLTTGEDIEGEDPAMNAVALDVNSRMSEWTAEYPELQSLVNALRVYVAAVKITSTDSSICHAVARIPIMPSEMLDAPLPSTRPAVTSITALSLRVAGDDGGEGEVVSAGAWSVSGGVSLAVKGAPGSVTYVNQRTPVIDALLSAPDGVSDATGSRTIAFNMDLVETAASITRFVPVTEADVLGGGTTLVGNWRTLLRQRAARWLSEPFAGTVIMLPLVGLLFFAVGAFIKLFHRGPLFGTRRKSR